MLVSTFILSRTVVVRPHSTHTQNRSSEQGAALAAPSPASGFVFGYAALCFACARCVLARAHTVFPVVHAVFRRGRPCVGPWRQRVAPATQVRRSLEATRRAGDARAAVS